MELSLLDNHKFSDKQEIVNGSKRTEPNKKNHACPFDGCTAVFDRPYRLAQHRLVHDNVKPFTCTEKSCTKAYSSKSHLDRHIKTAHKEPEINLLYSCPKCLKKYANRQNLKRHIKVSHIDNNKPFGCALCRVYFKKKHQLKAHMFTHNGVKSFRCTMCERDFVSLVEKKKHIRNHKTHECEHCETKFTRWTELMHHKRVDHGSLEYICHECGKIFKDRGRIIRHVKKHMPNAQVNIFFCPYDSCVRSYSRNSNLKQHILVKHKGLTFDCSLCGAKLSTKAKLNEHLDRHNRPNLPLKVHKTLKTGRKKRKDAGTIRYETAMRLTGIVKQKIEEGMSRFYYNCENLRNVHTNTEYYSGNGGDNHTENKVNVKEETAVLPCDVHSETKVQIHQNIEVKVENTHTISETPNTSTCMSKSIISCRIKEPVTLQSKLNMNKPTSLIEILNRPALKINRREEANISSELNSSREYNQIKIELTDNSDIINTPANMPNISIDKSDPSGMFNKSVTIKKEEMTEEKDRNEQHDIKSEHNLLNDYGDYKPIIQNGASNPSITPCNPMDSALSSIMHLYWSAILDNNQRV